MFVKLCTDKLNNMNQQTKFQTYSSILQSMIFNEFVSINILNSIVVAIWTKLQLYNKLQSVKQFVDLSR